MRKLTRAYCLWIRLKYQYYKWYWRIFPPKRKLTGFYGWTEVGFDLLDSKAVGIGIIDHTEKERSIEEVKKSYEDFIVRKMGL